MGLTDVGEWQNLPGQLMRLSMLTRVQARSEPETVRFPQSLAFVPEEQLRDAALHK